MTGSGRRALTVVLTLALLALLVSPRISAQPVDRPTLLPLRDVAVIYRVNGIGMQGAHKLQVTYTQRGERARIDYFRWFEAKYPFLSLIFDRPAGRLIVVLPEQHAFTQQPIGNTSNPASFLKPEMRFTRKDTASVLGTACTEWNVRLSDEKSDIATACMTDDGVMLRLVADRETDASITATVVQDGSPPDAIFEPPSDFERRPVR